MAIKQVRVDDLDGSEGDDIQTVAVIVDGITYDLDLHGAHREELSNLLAPYAAAGRRRTGKAAAAAPVSKGGAGGKGSKSEFPEYAPENVRAWAEGAGIEVNERGRIANRLLEEFFHWLPIDVPNLGPFGLTDPNPEYWLAIGQHRGELMSEKHGPIDSADQKKKK
ncbi:histone-like nucleoid-structuring protein Lsr2 [Citricoccus nitrophenolicus]|uniref:histone-like nucleoid-structuring protein Lsr2 n=1 Tax=Citricoccus nitrophenolicus TaxID=863575 RepID=UPI0031F16C5D